MLLIYLVAAMLLIQFLGAKVGYAIVGVYVIAFGCGLVCVAGFVRVLGRPM